MSHFLPIESSLSAEYVDNLFQLDSRYGWPRLADFEAIFNKEMWWAATEVSANFLALDDRLSVGKTKKRAS